MTGPSPRRLSQRLGLPADVENDANAAAWAEAKYGAGRGFDDQLMVTVGTGIGGGLVLGGELYRGGHGMGAEIGHMTLVRGGRQCECGRLGCWEEYASGSSLERDAREAAVRGEAPALLEAATSPASVTGQMVTALAQQGDADSIGLLGDLARGLATGISSLLAILDPSVVVIGGGVSAAGRLLLEPAGAGAARRRQRRLAPSGPAAAPGRAGQRRGHRRRGRPGPPRLTGAPRRGRDPRVSRQGVSGMTQVGSLRLSRPWTRDVIREARYVTMQSSNPVFNRSEGFNGRGSQYGSTTQAGAVGYPASGGPTDTWQGGQTGYVDQSRMSIDSVVQKTAITMACRRPGRGRHLGPHR